MRNLMPILDKFGMQIVQPVESGQLLQVVLAPSLGTGSPS
jgi:hypothetical protein